jgi:WD40 repeat protein/serine/threonine protein kinase
MRSPVPDEGKLTMGAANPEQSIFLAALELPTPAERAAYLKGACGPDPVLLANVQELLAAHDTGDDFLNRPPNATADEPLTERSGTVIGPYKLLQQIGEGGMGVVYMAEQQEPIRRRVALKIIKPGMDSEQVIARFEAERQALALMDHQNIAKVLDAGTTESGCPYFVMELVHGVPITQYCDDHHLTPKERLELFLPVCHAVQHAHQKGIIHRDLKPSNVLVCLYDGVPVPKVIDFGVAKATGPQLTERTMFTHFGTLVGTLEYMSPEQAEMSQLGIDTRSDVYSLGVLLYELLTGTTPLQRHRLREAGFDEIRRLIREEEPPRPSTRLSTSGVALAAISAQRQTEPAKLTRLVRGELDWIVMKALEKDRNRRYETANGLAQDVERYLHDEPVEACPPTARYRLRKFARKHQSGLATAAGFAILLVLGTAMSAWQAVRATQAETEALANEQYANANAAKAEKNEQEANQQRDDAQKQRDEVRALNDQLRRTLYAAHMNLAQHVWQAGGPARVLELLEQHRPKAGESDLRGFEWYYLNRLCHSDLLTFKGHTNTVNSVVFSPDGKRLASASGDSTVKVWDAQTGQELFTFKEHTAGVWSVAFSPDGKRLASTDGAALDKPGVVKVWDAQTGQELLSFEGHSGPVGSVAFSPDGKRLASAAWDATTKEMAVKVWDAQTGQDLLSLKTGGHASYPGLSLAFSLDGKRLAGGAKVWDAQTGQGLLSLKGHSGFVQNVAFSPDGKRLASTDWQEGREPRTLRVWDAQTGQELLTLKGADGGVAFSPDGKRLASACDKEVKVWDAQTGQELLAFKGHSSGVNSVAFSPDGKRLASAAWDKTVRIWDAQAVQKPLTLKAGTTSDVASVAFSPDGKRLASGSAGLYGHGPGEGKVWDAQTGQELFALKGHTGGVNDVVFGPDGKRLASVSLGTSGRAGEVKVWDAQTGRELLSLTFKGLVGQSTSVAFSPDGKHLASCGNTSPTWASGELKVWDAQTGQELLSLKHTSPLSSVVFSPDGKRLASTGWSPMSGSTLKVWDAQTGQELLSLKDADGIVAYSPDGKCLASGSKVWDAQTGEELLSLKGHTSWVNRVVFSPDGKRLASASSDKTVKVWDAQTGQELLSVVGHGGHVNGVAFSPDGHRLASGAADGTLTIWDATPLPEKP